MARNENMDTTMIHNFECTQCGSTDFSEARKKRVRCAHCCSLFKVVSDEPKLTISRGANVVFGKNANVEVRGDVEIEDGAHVEVQGKVSVLKGKKQQDFRLILIQTAIKGEHERGDKKE
jgi:hypothetical protein